MDAPKGYKNALVKFMSYIHKTNYNITHEFAPNDLVRIQPEQLCNYITFIAYGTDKPKDTDRPINARSNTLYFVKKALSYYMPRKNVSWDTINRVGNPTRSIEVNTLIKKIRKHEVRKEGAESQAVRPLEFEEFVNILTVIRTSNLFSSGDMYRLTSIITLQWQLIGRIDDIMKLQIRNLSFNPSHNNALCCQMTWSKNIMDERDSPTQIILPSMDDRICALLNLAVYLESTNIELNTNCDFLYANGKDGDRRVRDCLKTVIESESFSKLVPGKIGTHSFRKGASTYCARSGLSKDYVTHRGRWRIGKTQVDTYIDVNRPFPDAVTSACLCGHSGPGMYTIASNANLLTDTFLVNRITPKTCRLMGKEFARVLALPIIYAATKPRDHHSGNFDLLPIALKTKVISALSTVMDLPVDELNGLVQKRPIVVNGYGGQVHLVPLEDDSFQTNTNATTSNLPNNHSVLLTEIRGIHSTVINMKRRMEEIYSSLRAEVDCNHTETKQKIQRLNASIKRIAVQPVVRSVAHDHEMVSQPSHSVRLSKGPVNLFELWKEYQFGLGGRAPARLFSPNERGQNRSTYSLRKVFWDAVLELIRSGMTSDVAIDRVYSVYGREKSTTDILRTMRNDRKRKTLMCSLGV